MPVFPRGPGALPRLATPPRFPGALQSWGQSGKGQFRAVQSMGRVWQETYSVLDTRNPNVRALIAAINKSMREGVLWDVQHPYWHIRNGVGGGSPLVNGAAQTGAALLLDGASANITNWLRKGDLLRVVGAPVIFDVDGDVTTNGSGQATVPISPPLFPGGSPADNAIVTIDPTAIYFVAHLVDIPDFPLMDVTRYIDAGLTLTFREQPGALGGIVVSDAFNRADSATTLGTADTGHVWTAHSGTFGILSNQAYKVSGGGWCVASVDATVSNVTITLKYMVTSLDGGESAGLAFRVSDANNHFMMVCDGLNVTVIKTVAGSQSNLHQSQPTLSTGMEFKVVLSGTGIQVFAGASLIFSGTDSFNQSATRHGIAAFGGTLRRLEDFLVAI